MKMLAMSGLPRIQLALPGWNSEPRTVVPLFAALDS